MRRLDGLGLEFSEGLEVAGEEVKEREEEDGDPEGQSLDVDTGEVRGSRGGRGSRVREKNYAPAVEFDSLCIISFQDLELCTAPSASHSLAEEADEPTQTPCALSRPASRRLFTTVAIA